MQKRGKVGDKIDVSREELADFRRKYGANLTLRDLLNYDRTGNLPTSESKAAAGSGRGAAEGRKATDRDTAPLRADTGPAIPRRDKAAEAKGAETLERMKSRAERGMAVRSNEEMRDEAKGRTLGALGAAATLAGGPMLGRGLMSAMERRAAAEGAKRAAQEAARKEPTFKKGGSVKGGGCEARSKKTRYI